MYGGILLLTNNRTKSVAYKAALAETEGFEPSVRFPVRRFSKALVSATHPRLRLRRNAGPIAGATGAINRGGKSIFGAQSTRLVVMFIAGQGRGALGWGTGAGE